MVVGLHRPLLGPRKVLVVLVGKTILTSSLVLIPQYHPHRRLLLLPCAICDCAEVALTKPLSKTLSPASATDLYHSRHLYLSWG